MMPSVLCHILLSTGGNLSNLHCTGRASGAQSTFVPGDMGTGLGCRGSELCVWLGADESYNRLQADLQATARSSTELRAPLRSWVGGMSSHSGHRSVQFLLPLTLELWKPQGQASHILPGPLTRKLWSAFNERGCFGRLMPSSSVCLCCFVLVSTFISRAPPPPPVHGENYYLAWKIRIGPGSDAERLTSGEEASCGAGPLPLEDIWAVIGQVTAADELWGLDGFRDR